MLWQGQRESENVEDARGSGGGRLVMGGGIGTVILVVLYLVLGGDPQALFNAQQQAQVSQPAQVNTQAPRDDASKFVAVVLADTEDAWNDVFRQMGRKYEEPRLVLFTDVIQSGCGFARGATGPFYCPQDRQVYIDLGFFRQLQERLGAGGDFAEAYVIAHEVGHHVQKLLGITDRVDAARRRASEAESNRLSVRLELQADFLAGIWARYADRVKHVVEAGDIEEAIRAANAVGDDRFARLRRTRFIYPRHVGTTRSLVPPWLRDGRSQPGRYTQRA